MFDLLEEASRCRDVWAGCSATLAVAAAAKRSSRGGTRLTKPQSVFMASAPCASTSGSKPWSKHAARLSTRRVSRLLKQWVAETYRSVQQLQASRRRQLRNAGPKPVVPAGRLREPGRQELGCVHRRVAQRLTVAEFGSSHDTAGNRNLGYLLGASPESLLGYAFLRAALSALPCVA